MATEEQILEALKKVDDPELHKSLVELGMVDKIELSNSTADITIKLTVPGCPMKNRISADITRELNEIQDISKINVHFTTMTPQERGEVRKKVTGGGGGEKEQPDTSKIAKYVVAICSGKGGVGKSTVTANLARAFSEKGLKVGLLDADVYGFSIPRMLGVTQAPNIVEEMIIPADKEGIKVVSMGFFVPEDAPVIWRGPLIHKTITQFINDVVWDSPDVLLMDLPPGTGDVTITIAQTLPQAEMIVVTTPQPAAANVASRVAALAEKTNLHVLGVVENMSYYLLPDNTKDYIFGKEGGRLLAKRIGAEFFGEIPLNTEIRKASDVGDSIFSGNGDNPVVSAYRDIADKIMSRLDKKQ